MPNKGQLLDLPHELQEYLFAHFDVQSVRSRGQGMPAHPELTPSSDLAG
jgi:hypothetical protein